MSKGVPKYESLVEVQYSDSKDFESSLRSRIDVGKNREFVVLRDATIGAEKRYTSVQYAKDGHLELQNEFVFMNHSCSPSLHVNVEDPHAIVITTLKEITKGDDLTFNYLTTEWVMDQPFKCRCQHEQCFGQISGAKDVVDVLTSRHILVNPHIKTLMQQ